MSKPAPEPGDFVPLPHLTFHVLLAVSERPRYGFDIGREIEERSDGRLRPSIGSLYLAMQRLRRQGLLEESPDRPDPEDDDPRRRYFRATELGIAVARSEAERLETLVAVARDRKLLGRR